MVIDDEQPRSGAREDAPAQAAFAKEGHDHRGDLVVDQ